MTQRVLNIAFIGAGTVNFGGAPGQPWDHARRLEAISLGNSHIEEAISHLPERARFNTCIPLRVVALCDPDEAKRAAILLKKRSHTDESVRLIYANTREFDDYRVMLSDSNLKIDAVYIGVPPFCHGQMKPGFDLELASLRAGACVFVEKPLSVVCREEITKVSNMVAELRIKNCHGDDAAEPLVVSVGYMFRYSRAAVKLKAMIDAHGGGRAVLVNAKYNTAYATIEPPFWWDSTRSGGPIVEQATHFVDLARFLGGDIVMDSIAGHSIPSTALPLSRIPSSVDESKIAEPNRIPRATVCSWKFQDGGVGTLQHSVLASGTDYECSLEVLCDGLSLQFLDCYSQCPRVVCKRQGVSEPEVFKFDNDDMYLSEDVAFLSAVLRRAKLSGSSTTNGDADVTTTSTTTTTTTATGASEGGRKRKREEPQKDGAEEAREDGTPPSAMEVRSTYEDATQTYLTTLLIRERTK